LKRIKSKDAYRALLDGSCETACPAGIDLDEEIIKLRTFLVSQGEETESNHELLNNIRHYGNPYGKKKQ
jgi:Fe-S oxidoreductase